jgi:LacI family transcriptional regulator
VKKTRVATTSLGDVARAAGVSKGTACNVLLNRPGPSQKTRERILAIARKLKYAPDAGAALDMQRVRAAKAKELLPIAWLNTHWNREAWHSYEFFSPYFRGAGERAAQLGYRLEEIWAHEPGLTMRRISEILYKRGIEGVIVTQPDSHVRLQWDHLAAVSLEGNLLAPRLHRVMSDRSFNLLLALKAVKRFGYRRIGICLDEKFTRYAAHATWAEVHHFQATTPEADRVSPFFYRWERGGPAIEREACKKLKPWIKQHRPQVIVGHSDKLVNWVEEVGYRVPKNIGVVHIARDDDARDWAGIDSNRWEVGATAAERVISLLQNHSFGVPKTAVSMMIRGTWAHGRTLLVPKGK